MWLTAQELNFKKRKKERLQRNNSRLCLSLLAPFHPIVGSCRFSVCVCVRVCAVPCLNTYSALPCWRLAMLPPSSHCYYFFFFVLLSVCFLLAVHAPPSHFLLLLLHRRTLCFFFSNSAKRTLKHPFRKSQLQRQRGLLLRVGRTRASHVDYGIPTVY